MTHSAHMDTLRILLHLVLVFEHPLFVAQLYASTVARIATFFLKHGSNLARNGAQNLGDPCERPATIWAYHDILEAIHPEEENRVNSGLNAPFLNLNISASFFGGMGGALKVL